MQRYPREPKSGEPLSADWGRDVIRTMRRITPLAGVNCRVSETPYGTFINPRAASITGGSAASSLPQPFDIEEFEKPEENDEEESQSESQSGESEETDPGTIHFAHPWYRIAGRTLTAPASATVTPGIVALEISWSASGAASAAYRVFEIDATAATTEAAELAALTAMQTAEQDSSQYIVPLYLINAAYSVALDMRPTPTAVMMEIL